MFDHHAAVQVILKKLNCRFLLDHRAAVWVLKPVVLEVNLSCVESSDGRRYVIVKCCYRTKHFLQMHMESVKILSGLAMEVHLPLAIS